MTLAREHLLKALEEAMRGKGSTAPNPPVGAVIVRENRIIANGYHAKAGSAHAEIAAIEKLSGDLSDCDLYVTLEPCGHFGKTPPCTDMIAQRGIRHVYFGSEDPNPVASCGRNRLRLANVPCDRVQVNEIDTFYKPYQKWVKTGLPFVRAKLAMTLDGKIAKERGIRVEITGDHLKELTFDYRRKADAILTTSETILADDPLLNVRGLQGTISKPIYVIDSRKRVSPRARVFETGSRVTLFRSEGAERLSLREVLSRIGKDGIQDLWVEAGGGLFESLVNEGLMDQGILYQSPKWFGAKAYSAFRGDMEEAFKRAHTHYRTFDNEIVLELNW